jgi:dienelactone hydrolase
LVITGSPEAAQGATWTYESVDDQVEYRLTGILRRPVGSARVPGVVISHGKGGMPTGYSRSMAAQMVPWGLLAIGVAYTHATTDGGLPAGGEGASPANIQRGKKTRELLDCLPNVDTSRVAAHGHSMGAFLTAALVGSFPGSFQAASHTAGGTSQGPNATPPSLAMQIRTPYQIHHGDADMVVALAQDQALDQILTSSGTEHEFFVYPGVDHQQMSQHATMLTRVREWYVAHRVLPP